MIRLAGTYTAVITPFRTVGGKVAAEPDYEALRELVEWQVSAGVAGIVALGTTGESVTLSDPEKIAIVRLVVETVKGRVAVLVGTGSNDTNRSIEFSKSLAGLGVDAGLTVAPYYNKPTQEGLFQHFSAIAREGGLPICLYNVPGRTSVDIRAETVARLARVPGIIGIKEASGSAERLLELAYIDEPDFSLLTGDDHLICYCMASGGRGAISASANVIPGEIIRIVDAGLRGDIAECLKAQKLAYPIIKALFLETNPAPAKAALQMLGRIKSDELRLPLVPVAQATREALRRELA